MTSKIERFHKPELLAPAGGLEQLKYALHFGADAVYCATDRFGLRQRADNFTLENIAEAVKVAHGAGARLFVTCNAYMNAEDLTILPGYLESLAQAGVDALIVSDLGAFRLARKHAPGVALHVSTQASCCNAEAAMTWYELGVRRVVCAREMSVSDIAKMRKSVPDDLELEVFVHGAMCMAISGRCLISDYMTGRSANRGSCTQPCRWSYTIEESSRPGEAFTAEEDERGAYIMNSKDLCMLGHLGDLVEAGVDSLKIEGRNKKAFYVATVVNAYRQVLDGAEPESFLDELDTISHRPYSTGFFYGPAEQDSREGEYLQAYDWVAEVKDYEELFSFDGESSLENKPTTVVDSSNRTFVTCRNRFYEGDVLEVLSPNHKVRSVTVTDLRFEFPGGNGEATSTANRAMEAYSFVPVFNEQGDYGLRAHDILRVKRIDPTQKN